MPEINVIIPQATCVTGYDLFQNAELRSVSYWRGQLSIGIVGSTSPGDITFDLKQSGRSIAESLPNTTGGANKVPTREDMTYIKGKIAPNIPIQLIAKSGAVANPVAVKLSFSNATFKKRSYPKRRYTPYRRY